MTSRMLVLASFLSALSVLGAACGSSGGSGTPSGAGGNGSGGSGSGGAGGGGTGSGGSGASACPNPPNLEAAAPTCNTFTNGATAVPFTARTGTPPAATGGPIRDGVYRSVRAEGYGAAAPQNGRRLSIVILDGGTRWLWGGDVLDAAGAATVSSLRANAAVVASGTSVAFTTSCMSGATSPLPASLDYTVTGDELALTITTASYSFVTTYARSGCP